MRKPGMYREPSLCAWVRFASGHTEFVWWDAYVISVRVCVCAWVFIYPEAVTLIWNHKGDTGSDQTARKMNWCIKTCTRARTRLSVMSFTYLWGYVVWSPAEGACAHSFQHVLFTHAKVSNLNVSLRIKHHIVQLQISEEADKTRPPWRKILTFL